MGRMTVDHQKCLSAPSFHEILQKCDEGFRIQLASVGGCPKFSTRVDRADHIEALPLTGGYHLGRFPLQPISAAQGGIRLKSRLVQKENLGPQPFGSPLERRIGLLEPELHRLRIPLVRSTQRLLRSYLQTRQQPTYCGQTQLDPHSLLNQGLYNPSAPQAKVKAILARVLPQDPALDLLPLLLREFGFGPCGNPLNQGVPALLLKLPQPRINGRARKSQRFHYDTGSLAVFHHPPNGKYSDVLQRFVIQCPTVYLCHPPFIRCSTARCLGKCTLSYGLVSNGILIMGGIEADYAFGGKLCQRVFEALTIMFCGDNAGTEATAGSAKTALHSEQTFTDGET